MKYEVIKDEFLISTDKNKIDLDYVHAFLTKSYWSPGVPIETVKEEWKIPYALVFLIMATRLAMQE